MEPNVNPSVQPQIPPGTTQVQPPITAHTSDQLWSGFQNILTFISMAFFAGALHTIWSVVISNWYPKDEGMYYGLSPFIINGAISSLIVSAPFFISLFLITNLKYIRFPELKHTVSKKILNYITLVITFLILLLRIISAINSALNEQFTVSFGLELLVTSLIIGTIFAYYLYEVRFEKQPASKAFYITLAIIQIILAIITLLVSLNVRSDILIKYEEMKSEAYAPPQNSPGAPLETTPIPTPLQSPNLPSSPQSVGGIEFTVLSGQISENETNKTLSFFIRFSANVPCPLTDGVVCGVNSLGVQVTDSEGYKIPRVYTGENALQDAILKEGEKAAGFVYFSVDEIAGPYYLTYRASTGEESEKIEVQFPN